MNKQQVWDTIDSLKERGVCFRLDGDGRVNIADTRKVISAEQARFLKENKPHIVNYLAHSARSIPIQNRTEATGQPIELSFAQQRLWFLSQLDGGSSAYNIVWGFKAIGHLDVDRLELAFNTLIERHQSLRTNIRVINDVPVQVAYQQSAPLRLSVEKVTESEVERLILSELSRSFNFSDEPLFRLRVLAVAVDKYVLLLNIHHIISDGWSMGILSRELMALYNGTHGQEASGVVPHPVLQYTDYVLWQRARADNGHFNRQISYWMGKLREAPPLLDLPTDFPRPAQQSYAGGVENIVLPPELTADLSRVATAGGATLFMTLLCAFKVLLFRYSGQTDIVTGTPIAGRHSGDLESCVGLFVNTLCLRDCIDPSLGFSGNLLQIKKTCVEAFDHHEVPFEYLVSKLNPVRSLSYSPLFQILFALQNTDSEQFELDGLVLTELEIPAVKSKFDLSMICVQTENGIVVHLQYATELFAGTTIKRFLGNFARLLDEVVKDSSQPVSLLPILSDEEKAQVVVEWNRTSCAVDTQVCQHQLFEHQAQVRPGDVAVIYGLERLTYQQLNRLSNNVANFLVGSCSLRSEPVALLLERSIEMVVAIFGVLKAGCCYVPLDPSNPKSRMDYMVKDSGSRYVLTQRDLLAKCAGFEAVEAILVAEIAHPDSTPSCVLDECAPGISIEPHDLAYIIYTSGSTGNPKGVMSTHAGLTNRVRWMQKTYHLQPGQRVLQKTPYTFDVSVWEFVWPLGVGATLVVAPPDSHKDPIFLGRLINDEKINVLHFVPSMLSVFIDVNRQMSFTSLTNVFCSGEALASEDVTRFRRLWPAIQLHNLYGPTEASIDVSYFQCEFDESERIPIGRPIDNIQLYIVDSHLNPVPIGVHGELCIAGVGLARGYLNKPELTEQTFVSGPFRNLPADRLYRTGDIARFLPDGNIDYIGRIDQQVKIRGLRIELTEIESAMVAAPWVKDAAVVVMEHSNRNRFLAAYIVPEIVSMDAEESAHRLTALELMLQAVLPQYMIPAKFTLLESLPVNSNGKLDRRALIALAPSLVEADPVRGTHPQTEAEQLLARIWSETLEYPLSSIYRESQFFDLGGDSLLSIRVVFKALQFGYQLDVKKIFLHPKLMDVAAEMRLGGARATYTAADGRIPLTAAQAWFFSEDYFSPSRWNIARIFAVSGPLDEHALGLAVAQVVERHEALRSTFLQEGAGWIADIQPTGRHVYFSVTDLSAYPPHEQRMQLEALSEKMQANLDLELGPLFAVRMVKLSHEDARIVIVLHHLVADGPSLGILFDDLSHAYQMSVERKPILLPRTSSIKEFTEEMCRIARSGPIAAEAVYWRSQQWNQVDSLPITGESGLLENTVASTRNISRSFACETTQALMRGLRDQTDASLFEILVAAISGAIATWTKKETVLLSVIDSGRTAFNTMHNLDLSRTIGWLSFTVPLFIKCGAEEDPIVRVESVKHQVRAIPNRGLGYDLLYWLAREDVPKLQNKSKIVLNYLGIMEDRVQRDDLLGSLGSEFTGATQDQRNDRSCIFMLIAYVYKGQLTIDWQYSGNLHQGSLVENLLDEAANTIFALASTCKTEV